MRFNAGLVGRGFLVYLTITALLYGVTDLSKRGPATLAEYTATGGGATGGGPGGEYTGLRAPFVRKPPGGG